MQEEENKMSRAYQAVAQWFLKLWGFLGKIGSVAVPVSSIIAVG